MDDEDSICKNSGCFQSDARLFYIKQTGEWI